MTSKILPSAERIRELLHYEPKTGVFTRLASKGRAKVGDVAGTLNNRGYLVIMIDGHSYKAHRLAWLWTHGAWPTNHIDHIDHDPANNRIDNLREATISENMQNQVCARSNNRSSGLLGTSWHKASKKWAAKIRLDGRQHHLGLFTSAEVAHAEYLRAKSVMHPFNTLMVDK